MRPLPALMVILTTLGGCASETMRNYVGHPLTDPVLDVGTPAAATDVDKDTRAFTWIMHTSIFLPARAVTSGSAVGSIWTTSSYYQPAQTVIGDCNYTLYAKRAGNGMEGPAAWIVTGFRPPRLMCE